VGAMVFATRLFQRLAFSAAAALLLAACGSGGAGEGATSVSAGLPPAPAVAADTTILFMGNSHTSGNDVPGIVAAMLRAGVPTKSVATTTSPDWMLLNERGNHEPSLALIASQRWKFVVLQAQDYSSSGQFVYPTTGAEKLVRLSRSQGAVPILFAEWPRRGIAETQRILDVYASVAVKEPACLPPIPQAFDAAAARHPDITLYASDGNHSAPPGAFLAALIIYATVSGSDPGALPSLTIAGVDADTQFKLRVVAADTLRTFPAKKWCPGD